MKLVTHLVTKEPHRILYTKADLWGIVTKIYLYTRSINRLYTDYGISRFSDEPNFDLLVYYYIQLRIAEAENYIKEFKR